MMTLKEITEKRPFGWFAVKQDLSPLMQWAQALRQGNSCAQYRWAAGPQVGSFTDGFFRRNQQLAWRIGSKQYCKKTNSPDFIQLLGGPDAGTATNHAIKTLQRHCNRSEYGVWKIFVVAAYPYLTEGLNRAAHVRCCVEIIKPLTPRLHGSTV